MTSIRSRLVASTCASLALLACLPSFAAPIELRDDGGNTVVLPHAATRIISLAPHVTELLFAAGAGAKVVGVVAYSDFPAEAQALPQVGSYNNVDMERVAALRPDLVVGWSSGNRDTHLEKLRALGIPVYLSEPHTLEDVARSLEALGTLAATEAVAQRAAHDFRTRLAALADAYRERPKVRMFYQVWNQPLMTINDTHLISDVIRLCAGENVFGSLDQIAPRISEEAVLAANPEAIIASGMGEARPDWLDGWRRWPTLEAVRHAHLFFVPPDLLQRHTPRILEGATQLCAHLDTVRNRRDATARTSGR